MNAIGFSRLVDAVQWVVGVAAGAALVMLFTLSGSPGQAEDAPAAGEAVAEPAAEEVVALGGDVYAEHCASCHGAAGGGGLGPPLAAVVESFSDPADQVAFVANGRGLMRGFADVLTAEELEAVVAFTRQGFR